MDDGVTVGGKLVRFKKKDLPNMVPPSLWGWLSAWLKWRDKHALPLSKGWAEHPAYFIEVLDAFDSLYSQWESRRRNERD